ncbi:MAG TPA: prepilin-type N-terminal cleavage/methylation domain-containing protein [Candidatus Baltobacteraceae bacterium]|jgi:general secretion pathway protein G
MKNQRGFTLIEMMVVVAIIAILAALLIPNFSRARAQAQTATCISNLKTIGTALELYYTDHQYYPTATTQAIDKTYLQATGSPLNGYLNQVPVDPAAGGSGSYEYSTQSTTANNGVAGYQIWCPGTHDPNTLQSVSPGTTSKYLRYDNVNGLSAVSGQGS